MKTTSKEWADHFKNNPEQLEEIISVIQRFTIQSEPEPEPLPYKGKLPDIEGSYYVFWEDERADELHSTRTSPDRRTAILEWNEFVRKMEGK